MVSEAKFLFSEKKRFLVLVLVLVGEARGLSEGTEGVLCREQNGNRLEENHAV